MIFNKVSANHAVSGDDGFRAGAKAPESLAESVVHAAADAAISRLNSVLGAREAVRDAFLTGPDGRALRNVLRRYALHALASSHEAET